MLLQLDRTLLGICTHLCVVVFIIFSVIEGSLRLGESRGVRAHSDWVRAVAWSPCGQWLASGGNDKMIYVYDAKTFEVKWPLNVGYAPFSLDVGAIFNQISQI